MKWEKTTGFIQQCTVPVVLAAKLEGSMEMLGLEELWGYYRGNSENLQHRKQANSDFRCAIYIQKFMCCKALRRWKAFHTKFYSRLHDRRYKKPLLLVPVHFWDALGTLKPSAASFILYPHSDALWHPPTSCTVFPPWKHKPQGWGCTAAFSMTQNLGEEPTWRSKLLSFTRVGKCLAIHHSDRCLWTSLLKYGTRD